MTQPAIAVDVTADSAADVETMERDIRERLGRGERIARDIGAEHAESLTFGERLSDRLAETAGSWTFLIGFFTFLGVWVMLNVAALFAPWDKYPFILLNLMLSMLAAVQAPVIMMSQRRQEDRDRLAARHDYEVNLRAEIEIQELHRKLDELREKHIEDLLRLQRQQIETLNALSAHLSGE
jgi:uncharacterized membrane protein